MDEDLRALEQEYCPPIDPGLIVAIYSDFTGQEDALVSARQLLDGLKDSALAEQSTEFEPSGHHVVEAADRADVDASSTSEIWATQTVLSHYSTSSTGNSTFSGGGRSRDSSGQSYEDGYSRKIENLDTQTKEQLLAETFPSLSVQKVAYTLRKCGNDFDQATDELLNHVYFEDTRASLTQDDAVVTGIDAFSHEHHTSQKRKKGKGKRRQEAELYDNKSSISLAPAANHWLKTSQDVEFISARTSMPTKAVSSLYHANGASLPATILEMVRREIEGHSQEEEETNVAAWQDAIALNADFPTVDMNECLAIIRLASPSTSKAHELAKALTQHSTDQMERKGGIKLDFRYAPLDLTQPATESPRVPSLAATIGPRDFASTARARDEAFRQASTAYRRGKSTPLMKAAAAYYAQEGRDLNANLKAMSAAEADALVSSQSGATYLDLHGVTVADATRIAKQRTRTWWNELGERRIPEWSSSGRRGGGETFTIITGLGRHSEGGRGKLGPAVAKTLVNEGWKVEIHPGELFVTGLARRR